MVMHSNSAVIEVFTASRPMKYVGRPTSGGSLEKAKPGKMVLNEGVSKGRGLFIWGIQLEWYKKDGSSALKLPVGSVNARTKAVAKKKASAYIRKWFKKTVGTNFY